MREARPECRGLGPCTCTYKERSCTAVLRVTDLSKPLEAESKLGFAPVVPSELCYVIVTMQQSCSCALRGEAESKLGSAPIDASEFCDTYIHTYTYIHT